MIANRSGQPLHILTCDIQKAFDETPRAALGEAMRLHGYPTELIRRVEMLQTCTGAVVRTDHGRTDPVTTVKGCKQGCPLSPITYCLFTNMLLKGLDNCGERGYAIARTAPEGTEPTTLLYQGYMDDLALFATSTAAATKLLSYAADFLAAYGMSFNVAKCRHTPVNA